MLDPKDRPFSPEQMVAILAAVATLVTPGFQQPRRPARCISQIKLAKLPEETTASMLVNPK